MMGEERESKLEQNISNRPSAILEKEENNDGCFCAKKQCMIGIASVAIGVGGFVVSLLI